MLSIGRCAVLPYLGYCFSGEGGSGAQWFDEQGNPIWPPNRGFDGEPVTTTLQPGTRIDRYGYDGGTFVSPEGTPYSQRALAPGTESKPYTCLLYTSKDGQMRHVMRYDHQPDIGIIYTGDGDQAYLEQWCKRTALNLESNSLGAFPAEHRKEAVLCML